MNVMQKTILTFILLFCCTDHVSGALPVPDSPEVAASSYVLMDYETGRVLAEKNPHQELPPASLTKIMTSYIIANELKQGRISNDDMVLISENAWAKNFPESSKMFIEVNKEVSVSDLHKGIIISSGNDASVAMAEHIGGTESGFVELMNHQAKLLGMKNTLFENSNGLTATQHKSTAMDMAILTRELIKNFPEVYKEYAIKQFTYNNIKQFNRNRLLWDKSLDVDGVKTGHTEAAGYCLVSSAVKDEMRLIAVVMGARSENSRKQESKKLLNFGFRFFETVHPLKVGSTLHEEEVWMGNQDKIQLGLLESEAITVTRGQRKKLKAAFNITERLIAPISKGQVVGAVYVQVNDETIAEMPLVALHDVEEGSWWQQFSDWVSLQFTDLL